MSKMVPWGEQKMDLTYLSNLGYQSLVTLCHEQVLGWQWRRTENGILSNCSTQNDRHQLYNGRHNLAHFSPEHLKVCSSSEWVKPCLYNSFLVFKFISTCQIQILEKKWFRTSEICQPYQHRLWYSTTSTNTTVIVLLNI